MVILRRWAQRGKIRPSQYHKGFRGNQYLPEREKYCSARI